MGNLYIVITLTLIIATASCKSLSRNYTEIHVYSFIWRSTAMYNLSTKDIIESCVDSQGLMKKTGIAFDSVFASDLLLFLYILDLVKKEDLKSDVNSNDLDIRLVCFISNPKSSTVDTISFSTNGYMMFNSKIFKGSKLYLQSLLNYLPSLHQKSIAESGILE